MLNITGRKVLISPLSWGLGHAARCVPVISHLLKSDCSVSVFASPDLISYLRQRFPDLNYIEDSTTPFSYGSDGLKAKTLFSLALKMLRLTRSDRKQCRLLCKYVQPDVIISDNRYGFYCAEVPSLLITHQIRPVIPGFVRFFRPFISMFLKRSYRHFTEVLIPDSEKFPGLAGNLSHPQKLPLNARYIGLLSRFQQNNQVLSVRNSKQILFIASGPGQHRNGLAAFWSALTFPESMHMILVGCSSASAANSQIRCIESPSDSELRQLICESGIIISACGYSTLMDLYALNRSAILVPTAGQTEQKYLAGLHHRHMVICPTQKAVYELVSEPSALIGILNSKEQLLLKIH